MRFDWSDGIYFVIVIIFIQKVIILFKFCDIYTQNLRKLFILIVLSNDFILILIYTFLCLFQFVFKNIGDKGSFCFLSYHNFICICIKRLLFHFFNSFFSLLDYHFSIQIILRMFITYFPCLSIDINYFSLVIFMTRPLLRSL